MNKVTDVGDKVSPDPCGPLISVPFCAHYDSWSTDSGDGGHGVELMLLVT